MAARSTGTKKPLRGGGKEIKIESFTPFKKNINQSPGVAMRDSDIRAYLHGNTLKKYHQDKNSCVLDEFGLCQGRVKVDIAVINGELHGFEIKSDRDTFIRLPRQIELYSSVLDRATIVVGESKASSIDDYVPSWWGIYVAKKSKLGNVKIIKERQSKFNINVNARDLVELLWREEAFYALTERNQHRGLASKPRKFLWDALVECVDLGELKNIVREAIKKRGDWRSTPLVQPIPKIHNSNLKLVEFLPS